MKLVLALGNPGARYAETRHNIGWIVTDGVAGRLGISFHAGRGEYFEAEGKWRGEETILVKPTTYMNNSGIAAQQLIDRYNVTPAEMLVIADEIQFPVGRMQIRPSGSDGGHNGLRSVIYHLDSHDFPRVRCGVGRDFPPGGMADYVLSPFAAEEKGTVDEMIDQAVKTVLTWIAEGTAVAMSRHNIRASSPAESGGASGDTDAGTDRTT